MTRFIENIDYETYKKEYDYRLKRNYIHQTHIIPPNEVIHPYFRIDMKGKLTAKKGYAWDGATGGIDTKDFMRGSLVHDIWCQAIAEGLLPQSYRKLVDRLLYRILEEDGMSGIRRLWIYNAIRLYVIFKY